MRPFQLKVGQGPRQGPGTETVVDWQIYYCVILGETYDYKFDALSNPTVLLPLEHWTLNNESPVFFVVGSFILTTTATVTL